MDLEQLSLHSIDKAILDEGPNSVVVDWDCVRKYLENSCCSDFETAYAKLAKDWLKSMAALWTGEYRVYESKNFLILSSRGERLAGNLARLGEKAFSTMTSKLPDIAAKDGFGKFVCIVSDSQDHYYNYAERFFPDGEFGASGGMFLRGGYSHFLLNHAEPWFQEHALVHELTHALLQRRALPLWLEEGITQLMEEAVLGNSQFVMNREELARHREYWAEQGLAGFWYGSSFHRPDDGMELSYSLSQVIVRNMLSRSREIFLQFVLGASLLDCGNESSQAVYQRSLGDWAAQFLGEGDWEVTVSTANE